MAENLTILFDKVRKGTFNTNETNAILVKLDAVLSEDHIYPGRVTKYPIEDGSNVSDHIRNDPERISVRGFVTNSPVAIFGTQFSQDDPVQIALEALLGIRDNKELVRLVTLLKIYDNMAMENLVIPVTASAGEVLRFTAEFTKITKVTSEVVDIPRDQLPLIQQIQDQGVSPLDRGYQTTTPSDSQTNARLDTILGVA